MPPDLAALLSDAGLVTGDDLERARARQREAGGGLDTALLELGLVPEAELAALLQRATGLPPAPEGLRTPDPRARRVFPARVAERHGLAPYRLEERELSVLAAYPVDLAVLDEISFMLSLHLVPHVAPEWRVRELMARVYGTGLGERYARLRDAAATSTPSALLPSPLPAARGEEVPGSPTPTSAATPAPADEPLAAALAQAVEADGSAPAASAGRPPPEGLPRWSREEAFAALEAAGGRDEVVAVALRYARDFFEASAVFAVTRDRVAGQDAVGWPEARARCRSVQVPLHAVGLFETVIATSGPYLGPVARESGNEALLAALGRSWPRIALLYPVTLRERTVCVLYADNGQAPVSPRRLGDLLLLAGALGGAFDRILRQTKRSRAADPATPGEEPGWSALETARAAPSEAPPPAGEPPATAGRVPPPGGFDPSDAVRRLAATARGSAERGRLVALLVQQGPGAAAALRAAFPGPLDPPGPAEVEAHLDERGPLLAALAALGTVATPYLVELLEDPSPLRRRLAAQLLGAVRDASAFLPLAERALDPDAGVAEAARAALAACRRHPDFHPVLGRLRRAVLEPEPTRAAAAAWALARLGDGEAVPLLAQGLEAPEPLQGAAADALAALTGRRLGADQKEWLAWWRGHRAESRDDWLFGALGDPDREVRVAAAEALRAAAGPPPAAWSPDAPAEEREEGARAWRAWWRGQGLGE